MIAATQGIVLRRIKYGESSKIVHIYTEDFGKLSFMIHGSKSKKNPTERYLQPMYALDMQVYFKESREVQKVKEINLNPPWKNIPFDFKKTALSQFMAETVNKTLREGEPDKDLFGFLKNITTFLDETDMPTANFAPLFMVKYSRFLGLQINNNFSESRSVLDMQAGKFITGHPIHKHFAHPETARLIHEMLNSPITAMHLLNTKKENRNHIISLFIDYFNFHLNKPGKINSVSILSEVFGG